MSLPVVLPGSCCPVAGVSLASQLADPSFRTRHRCISGVSRMPGSQSRLLPALLPGRPLLSLGLLQLVLGCSMVALSFGALSLSSSPPIRNSCPFWAGSSVILSGIIGLTTWRRPVLLLVNLFVLLSVVCVLLNLAGFVLCCQGAQLVSSMSSCQLSEVGDVCQCCADTQSAKCPEEKLLKLYPGNSCSTMRMLLKKVLFALCALNALTTAVCLVAAALRYLQIFAARRPCIDEPRPTVEEGEEPARVPDPDEFVPPVPPPSYFSTFYSYTPRLARRMFGNSVIPLPHIYGARIKGVEVFCPLDPPPPYETVANQSDNTEQGAAAEVAELTGGLIETSDTDGCCQASNTLLSQPKPGQVSGVACRRSCRQLLRRSNSDPVLLDVTTKEPLPPSCPLSPAVLSCEAATQTEARPELATVTLRRGRRYQGPRRPRPSSLVDYQSYRDTKQLVAQFLEHSPCSMTPEVQEVVNSIKTVLRSDQEHMEEAVLSASFIDQVITGSQARRPQPSPERTVHTLPSRKRPGLLHLHSCGDLSTFTAAEPQPAERRRPRAAQDRPRSLIGVFRETVL
ncbi:endosomal transmembrane epsin interactor 1 isoform X2 [Lepisosteus oculatus]|uniref:endosomal transmembrane epsin interactor 1 isoform X2 n=1 Tax=Lepisosteus oculatus TaxID=7918 RepID=UPI00073FBCA6|nr:PREDICTED: protein FAM189A2 isoform X2 [Lepisosteus oculatus]